MALRNVWTMGVIDLQGLPRSLQEPVNAALADGADCEAALEALNAYFAGGGARTVAVLLATATLTFEDARRVVLHRITEAGLEALRLIDEARAIGGCALALESTIRAALDSEAERENRLRRALSGEPTRPVEMIELAHTLIRRGEDDCTAKWLIRRACGSSGGGSGVFQVPTDLSA